MLIVFFVTKSIYFSRPILDLSTAISVNFGEAPESNRLPEKAESKAEVSKTEAQEPVPPPEVPAQKKPVAQKKETPQPKAKEIPKPDTINLAKAKQKSALDKLKKSSALDKIKQELKNDSIANLKSQEKKAIHKKSNIAAAGSVLTGLDKIQANNYLSEIDRSIKQFWTLPQWLINKPLKAQALVKFNMQGQIQSSKIVSSSGNNSYDQYCLKAIEDAAPFPKVPDKLTEKFSVDGIVIGFPE